MTATLRFARVRATLMRRTSSTWPSRRSGLDRTKGFSDLSWPVAKYWAIERILACGLCLVLTFCKFSQFQFGWLQCLLSQIDYKFVGPSSLMSLCVWPFQTTVRCCEAYTTTVRFCEFYLASCGFTRFPQQFYLASCGCTRFPQQF